MTKFQITFFLLGILYLIPARNGFQGIYYCTINEQKVFMKILYEEDLAILELLDQENKYSRNIGIIFKDSVFFPETILHKEQVDVVLYFQDYPLLKLKSSSNILEIEINKIAENTDLKLVNIPKLLKNNLDPNLIGDWTLLYSKDEKGSIINDEFKGKGYLINYAENGKLILDPRAFRNSQKEFGISNFSYNDIPIVYWKTIGNKVINQASSPQGNFEMESTYFIKSDTLYKFSFDGSSTIYVRK
jgi:hypothetical protein